MDDLPRAMMSLQTSELQQDPLLLTLPIEVLNLILTRLPWPTLMALRLSHRHFAIDVLPVSSLEEIHRRHQQHTWNAERYFLGIPNPTWTGFTQGWGLSGWHSFSSTLPCYHCLRWLPSADKPLATSAFSRGMAIGRRDMGMEKARSRVCVECGLRCGLYTRGNRVRGQVICLSCGKLGVQIRRADHRTSRHETASGLLKGKELRWHYFCQACINSDSGLIPETRLEFEHERRWGKYERGLAAGKKYRAEKGKRLRAERGILDPDDNDSCDRSNDDDDGKDKGKGKQPVEKAKHWCPVLHEQRMCQCWKAGPDSKPDWAKWVEDTPWIW